MQFKNILYEIVYFIRKKLPYIISSILCMVFYFVFFNISVPIVADDMISNSNVKNLYYHEAVISNDDKALDDGFIYFEGLRVITGDDSINADMLMLRDVDYKENIFGYKNQPKLNADECVISKNLLIEYKIAIGDYLEVLRSDIKYKVVGELKIQHGIEKNRYNDDDKHKKGIIIFGNNEDLPSISKYKYFYSINSIDGFESVEQHLVFDLKAKIENRSLNIAKYYVIFIVIYLILLIFLDMIICRKVNNNYLLKYKMGLPIKNIYLQKAIQLFFVYILSFIIVIPVIFTKFISFGDTALYSILYFALSALVINIIYSIFCIWRFIKWMK